MLCWLPINIFCVFATRVHRYLQIMFMIISCAFAVSVGNRVVV